MVVDTSALLAVLFDEEHCSWVVEQFKAHAGELVMSTVSLTETLIRLRDRTPDVADDIEARLLASDFRFVPPDTEQARAAASARLRWPLNLGDCFVYALAAAEDAPILTLDAHFTKIDRQVVMP